MTYIYFLSTCNISCNWARSCVSQLSSQNTQICDCLRHYASESSRPGAGLDAAMAILLLDESGMRNW